jgi:hypothetical protein
VNAVNDGDSGDDSVDVDEISVRLAGVSVKSVLQGINMNFEVWETLMV